MSLQSAKMRLDKAVAQRDSVQREVEDTDRQLQEINRKQAEIAQKLFIQGGIDIYRQTQQIEDYLKLQNEKIDRASKYMNDSAAAVKRSNEKLNKIDLESLEYITNTLKELDNKTDKTYAALLDSKKEAYEAALNEFMTEHERKKDDLNKIISGKQNKIQELNKQIRELESKKPVVEAKEKFLKCLWLIILLFTVLLLGSIFSILAGLGIAQGIFAIWTFIKIHWIIFTIIGIVLFVLFCFILYLSQR